MKLQSTGGVLAMLLSGSLPRARQLRVLLGDPPVDWDRVSKQDLSQWQRAMAERDSHPADSVPCLLRSALILTT